MAIEETVPLILGEDPYSIGDVIAELTEMVKMDENTRGYYDSLAADSEEIRELEAAYEDRKNHLLDTIEVSIGAILPIKEAETNARTRSVKHTYHLSLIEDLESLKFSLERGSQADELTPMLLETALGRLKTLWKGEMPSEEKRTSWVTRAPSATVELAKLSFSRIVGAIGLGSFVHYGAETVLDKNIGPESVNESPQALTAIGILVAVYLVSAISKRGENDRAIIDNVGKLNTYVLKVTDLINEDTEMSKDQKREAIEKLAHFAANFGFNLHERTTKNSSAPINFEILARSLAMIKKEVVDGLSLETLQKIEVINARTEVNESKNLLSSLSGIRVPGAVKEIISGSVILILGVVTATQGAAIVPSMTAAVIMMFSKLADELDRSILQESITSLPVKKRIAEAILRINQIAQFSALIHNKSQPAKEEVAAPAA